MCGDHAKMPDPARFDPVRRWWRCDKLFEGVPWNYGAWHRPAARLRRFSPSRPAGAIDVLDFVLFLRFATRSQWTFSSPHAVDSSRQVRSTAYRCNASVSRWWYLRLSRGEPKQRTVTASSRAVGINELRFNDNRCGCWFWTNLNRYMYLFLLSNSSAETLFKGVY